MSDAPVSETQIEALRQRAGIYGSTAEVDRDAMSLAFGQSWATDLELLVGGETFFPRIGEDMEAAQYSIHVNQFGFKSDALGTDAAGILVRKANEGVKVRLVVDDQGSMPWSMSSGMYRDLAAAGVEVVVNQGFRPIRKHGLVGGELERRINLNGLGHPDHRKSIIIDGRIGYVGGAGFQEHFETGEFHDLFVRMSGAVVSQLQLVFLASFRYLGGPPVGDLDALFPLVDEPAGAAPATVLHNAPGFRPISVAIDEIIDSSRARLDIVNPYVADPPAVRRMVQAARRGVKVRLLVPAKANNPVLALAQRHHHAALLDAGVEIWEHPRMVHSKAFVRDGHDVLVGTCNLEAWSLKRSYEIDIRTRSADLAQQFEERFFGPAIGISRAGSAPEGAVAKTLSRSVAAFHRFL
jgi:cardiolipin synthase A/B